MNEALVEQWNDTVSPNDTVYLLGDVAFTLKPAKIEEIVSRLKGSIVLVPGNHDGVVLKLCRDGRLPHVTVSPALTELSRSSKLYVLLHYPMLSWNGSSRGSIHLHGHTHGKTPSVKLYSGSARVDVCWDLRRKLLTFEDIDDIIAALPSPGDTLEPL